MLTPLKPVVGWSKVPNKATPTVPPIWRTEFRAPDASPEFSCGDEIKTPAVIAGIIRPMPIPNTDSPVRTAYVPLGPVPNTRKMEPTAATANPLTNRMRR